MLLGCSVPKDLVYEPEMELREKVVYLMDTNEPIAEVTGIDWAWFSGRAYKSYHVRMLDKKYTPHEGALVKFLSYPSRSTTEVHVSY
jgi:hypothetical protein